MKVRSLLVFATIGLAFSLAHAQWVWLDAQGRKVFSDRPPGNDVPLKNILKQPSATPSSSLVFKPLDNKPAEAAPLATTPSGIDASLEAKKKQADAQEAAKIKAEQERQAMLKADNCNRAKQAKASYESGIRIAHTDSKGEVSVINDEQRAAEINRLQGIIAQTCN